MEANPHVVIIDWMLQDGDSVYTTGEKIANILKKLGYKEETRLQGKDHHSVCESTTQTL